MTRTQKTRVTIFVFVAVAVVAMVWDDFRVYDRGDFLALTLVFALPAFLGWFFFIEIHRNRLTKSSWIVPILFLGTCLFAHQSDAALMMVRNPPRMRIANNLKLLVFALANYQDAHGTLPPAFSRSPEGKPLLSWRVLILPYLENEKLYARFNLDEPWDSPHNQALIPEMPKCFFEDFLATSAPGMTYYRAFTGPSAGFEGERGLSLSKDFPDPPRTILLVEAREPTPWTKPEEFPIGPETALPEVGAPRKRNLGPINLADSLPVVFSAAMADGSIRTLKVEMDAADLKALILRDSKEKGATDKW
jgi:Protein of unknown function (DUF1559)